MKGLIVLCAILMSFIVFGQEETNFTDENGKAQGYWVFYGKDMPDMGYASDLKVEDGLFLDGHRIGAWTRYNLEGQPLAITLYGSKKESLGLKLSVFAYQYHPNKQVKNKPALGLCESKANVYLYDNAGLLTEFHSYDSLCNDLIIANISDTVSVNSLEYFNLPPTFNKSVEFGQIKARSTDLKDLNNYYFIDFEHKTFQFGTYKNGVLWSGSECVLDEEMILLSIRVFKEGKYVYSFLP